MYYINISKYIFANAGTRQIAANLPIETDTEHYKIEIKSGSGGWRTLQPRLITRLGSSPSCDNDRRIEDGVRADLYLRHVRMATGEERLGGIPR